MARYDRIAPLDAPSRDRAFDGWLVLRDLESHERDPDLGRRARLRFLALRPVRRLVRRGIENVPAESFERQVEGVREELGHLPARDPERLRLAQFLHRIRSRTPLALTTATLDLGEVAEAARHLFAAEEFYRTALELADMHRLAPEQAIALRLLGRVFRKTEGWADAERAYGRAAEIAHRLDDRRQWLRAIDGLGLTLRLQQKVVEAAQLYDVILARGREWDDDHAIATARHGLAQVSLEAGDPDRAATHAWEAFQLATDAEDRLQILGTLGDAFTRLGLYQPAERCLLAAAHNTRRTLARTNARLNLAIAAAGDGRIDAAREHLREAIRVAEEHRFRDVLARAEDLLSALERAAAGDGPPGAAAAVPSRAARRIAAEVAALGEPLVPAAG